MTQTIRIKDGDWTISPVTGRPEMIDGLVKLRQDIRELLSIQVLPNGFGTGLEEALGVLPEDEFAFRAEVQRRIRRGVEALQKLQARFHLSERTLDEIAFRISSLSVHQVQGQKTSFAFNLGVLPASGGQPVTVAGAIV